MIDEDLTIDEVRKELAQITEDIHQLECRENWLNSKLTELETEEYVANRLALGLPTYLPYHPNTGDGHERDHRLD